MLTWFGYKSSRVVSEFASSFSWEDGFSNLLGTTLAAAALRDNEHSYDEAMTLLLSDLLESLDVQPMKVAQQIAKDAKGKWYRTRFPIFMYVIQRNLDIGEDGTVQSLTHEGEGIAIPIPEKNWEDLGINYPAASGRGIKKASAGDSHGASDIPLLGFSRNYQLFPHSHAFQQYLQNNRPSKIHLPTVSS